MVIIYPIQIARFARFRARFRRIGKRVPNCGGISECLTADDLLGLLLEETLGDVRTRLRLSDR